MSARLGQIPELVQAISALGSPQISVALMQSCRGFFNLLAPLIWEHVKGAEIVFALAEGTDIVVEKDYQSVYIVSSPY
jgi:hypothetical protein